MLPSAHVLPALAVSVRTKPKAVRLGIPLLVLALHYPFDWVPHIEPSMFDGVYTNFLSWGFVWTVADILCATWVTRRLGQLFPSQRTVLWLILAAGLLPDLVQVWSRYPLPQPMWMPTYNQWHEDAHRWKYQWSIDRSRLVGGFTTFWLWGTSSVAIWLSMSERLYQRLMSTE